MIIELDDVERANEIYDTIDFPRSESPRDRVYAVMEGDAIIALGRFQRWTDDVCEVGGFWVREDQRRAGLARQLITHVLAHIPEGPSVWCIAFDHLVPFYGTFDLHPVPEGTDVPESIQAKAERCLSMRLNGRPVRTTLLRWR